MKRVDKLTYEELVWLHDNDFARLFNDLQMIDKYRAPAWKITLNFFEPFTSDRYRVTAKIEQIEIVKEKYLVIFEGWLSIKDTLLKRNLIVECFGFADATLSGYQLIAKHTPKELSQLMEVVEPGKALKIENVEEDIKEVLEDLSETQMKGGKFTMGEFFKLLGMYAESIQNAGQSMDLMLKILQERIKMVEQNSEEYASQLFEDLYNLQYRGMDLLKQSDILLVQIMNLCSKLSNSNVTENKMTA